MFSNFFIKRPIFAIVVSLVIVISGLISMFQLPIEQYPNMAPVQIMVTASYPGADAKTVAETVAAPIETQVNGVDNMIYMTSSSSSTGTMMLTVGIGEVLSCGVIGLVLQSALKNYSHVIFRDTAKA